MELEIRRDLWAYFKEDSIHYSPGLTYYLVDGVAVDKVEFESKLKLPHTPSDESYGGGY